MIPAPRESGFTTTTPFPLYWARYGPVGAPQLLVLHGGPGAHHDYLLPQMLELADTHELVFYDQRGGGRSKTDARDLITWQTQVDDLALVAKELLTGTLTLVGYSWGALLALLYVARQTDLTPTASRLPSRLTPQGSGPPSRLTAQGSGLPSRLTAHASGLPSRLTAQGSGLPSRLLLISPASITREYRRQFESEFARRQSAPWVTEQRAALAASGLRESDPAAHRQRAFELSVAGYFADPARATELTPFRVTSRVQQSIWESLGEFDIAPALRACHIPALIVHGRQDPIPLASSQELAEVLGARLVVLDNCGHVPYVEGAAPLFAAIREFLGQPAGAAAEQS